MIALQFCCHDAKLGNCSCPCEVERQNEHRFQLAANPSESNTPQLLPWSGLCCPSWNMHRHALKKLESWVGGRRPAASVSVGLARSVVYQIRPANEFTPNRLEVLAPELPCW